MHNLTHGCGIIPLLYIHFDFLSLHLSISTYVPFYFPLLFPSFSYSCLIPISYSLASTSLEPGYGKDLCFTCIEYSQQTNTFS